MTFHWPFSATQSPSGLAEAHQYAIDIATFSKLRSAALQRLILQPTDTNRAEVKRLDEEIAIMQRVHLKLLAKLEGRKKADAEEGVTPV